MSNVSTTIQGWLVIIFPIEFLVGGFNSSETYYSMGRIIPYIMKKMFQPTNQICFPINKIMMATLPQLMAHLLPLFICCFSNSIINFCRIAWPTSDKNLRASAQPVLPTPQQHRRSSGSDRSDSLLWGYHGNTMEIYPLVNKHSY